MSFDIFDEQFYLANNPDVAAAVENGDISSGLAHFQQAGINEGRTSISSLYNEVIYLRLNPDVAAAVNAGIFSSGLQHWILQGEAEGRVGRTGLYNEEAYLQRYQDVAAAVEAGIFGSGFEHFAQFVLPDDAIESRWEAIFDERFYLNKYEDVAAAVTSGAFESGLSHFLTNGLAEGRDGAPFTPFNERFYLFTNPDVAAAVEAGALGSGLEHYARFGQAEGRSGGYFNEELYRFDNADVEAAIASGSFDSGAEHYLKFGQYEPTRSSFFLGSSRNDTIRSYGAMPILAGVSVTDFDVFTGQLTTGSVGTGEVDILVAGGDVSDTVFLGNPTTGQALYLGNGRSDYALVRDFNPSRDRLLLAGDSTQYVQLVGSGSLNIFFQDDLVAIVEGVTAPLNPSGELANGFFLGASGPTGIL